MVGPILVTYASRHGSTAGVAQAIGTVLAQRDLPVEVRAMETVLDLGRYRAVVAGSAIQNGAWLPEALEFVRRHRPDLDRRPFAAFLVTIVIGRPFAPGRTVSRWRSRPPHVDPTLSAARDTGVASCRTVLRATGLAFAILNAADGRMGRAEVASDDSR